jgi:hypothetical protein
MFRMPTPYIYDSLFGSAQYRNFVLLYFDGKIIQTVVTFIGNGFRKPPYN